MSFSDWWCSPPEITQRLTEFYGGPVEVDPCSNERSIVNAILAMTSGGLVLPWRLPPARYPNAKRTGYQNDPYSKAGIWTTKMLAELAAGNLREHIRLSMFSTSSWWWADMCYKPRRNPRILALKRIAFVDPFPWKCSACDHAQSDGGMCKGCGTATTVNRGKPMSCRFEPALTYFGPRVRRFDKVFASLTRWSTWGRS